MFILLNFVYIFHILRSLVKVDSDVVFDEQVSVLDVDICGPSMPRIMGLEGEQVWNKLHFDCIAVFWVTVYTVL